VIIPTPEFDARFADDGVPFRTKMIAWIQSEFADVLGKKANLLKLPNGLEVLAQMYGSNSAATERKAA